MEEKTAKASVLIKGMTCSSCELRLESMLNKLKGVLEAKVSLAAESAEVIYNDNLISITEILKAIEAEGYEAQEMSAAFKAKSKPSSDAFKIDQLIGIGIIILALYIIIKNTIGFNFIPEVDQSMGYGILFLVGALTSLHCIAMCGGINMSQCVSYSGKEHDKMSRLKPSILYNAGRVVSYTIIGGLVGAIGSVVSFSGTAKGLVAMLAGVFMIIMGLNMMNISPWLRRFNIRMPKLIGQKLYGGNTGKGPFYIGLLNGFMPCGPLQSMQLYALGTGSFAAGAASMFFFSLGTVPLMFGLGALSTILSKKFTGKLMKFSAILVVILGVGMMMRGLSLSGFNVVSASTESSNIASIEGGVQTVSIEIASNRYQPIVVQKGIPVKFIINAKKENINGCNNSIIISKYGIQKDLKPGENIIEFTPDEAGTIPYSCWMGMIRSSIKVVDDIKQIKGSDIESLNDTPSPGAAGGCCAGSAGAKTIADTTADEIYIAKAVNGLQEVTITVDDKGYSPNVIVLQRGMKVKFKFDPVSLNQCNYSVVFPEYGGKLDLNRGELETPELEITEDFGFSCWMGMLRGYVEVVDDVNNIDKEAILQTAKAYSPTGGAGGSCH